MYVYVYIKKLPRASPRVYLVPPWASRSASHTLQARAEAADNSPSPQLLPRPSPFHPRLASRPSLPRRAR